MSNSDLTVRVEGRVGYITLTRAKVLNAVNQTIVSVMTQALTRWATDPQISMVMIDSDFERAFSAGGDLSAMYHYGKTGEYEAGNAFWREEYCLNAMIARYPKPYVAFMDGIVMGGGVGLSAHGSHRIVTEHSIVAMPEAGIGLITDVGGTYLLNQAPGHVGEYLGLTGTRMNGADAIHANMADYLVPRERLNELKAQLIATGDVREIEKFAVKDAQSPLAELQPKIDAVFAADTIQDIRKGLSNVSEEWARKAEDVIAKASPISLLTILEAVRHADTLEVALQHEYRFVSRVLEHGDFVEGIRAVIIDKDRNPKWRYSQVEDVPQDLLHLFAAPVDGGDPVF